MALSVGDIVAITYVQKLFGQRILNTLHYKVLTDSNGWTVRESLNAINVAFGLNDLYTALKDWWASDLEVHAIQSQVVYPVRSAYVSNANGDTGLNAGECLQSNTDAVITKATPTPGRDQVSNVFLAGITDTSMTSGLVSASGLALLELIGEELVQIAEAGGGTITLEPCIYHKNAIAIHSSAVDRYRVQDQIRVRRRRTVGLGI